MKDAEELARETIGADALAGVGYDQYIPWVVKGIKAARAEMEREHRAPRETVLTKEQIEPPVTTHDSRCTLGSDHAGECNWREFRG